jgi:RNA polymerase sigma-70 factor (subfamily 1)
MQPNDQSTAELDRLLERARAGETPALAALLEKLTPELRRRVSSKMSGPWKSLFDEDDVLQVTFMEACTRLDKFTGGGSSGFLAWLSRMAENNRIDAVRALEGAKRPGPSKRVTTQNHEDSAQALIDLLGVTSTTPSRQAARGEAGRLLDVALAALPTDYERVIRLYDLKQMSVADVAKDMGRSEGAVFMLRARAHERLKEVLGPGSNFFSTPS